VESALAKNTGENRIVAQLRAVAAKLTGDVELRKDLMQEMFLHLVKIQTHMPGRTLSWYIKSCEFHARNHLRHGRSIDSHKRAGNGVPYCESARQTHARADNGRAEADPVDIQGELVTRDLVDRMLPHLTETQQRILFLLMKGFGVRETARELGITHPAVIKHRKKIARIARELLNETGGGNNDAPGFSVGACG
jgi:RNA polymerase sigma factor (sigma-70 family)